MKKNIVELALLLDFYGDILTEKQRDYLEMYSQNDLSLSEIAENEGITRQGVRDIVSRAENLLKDYEAKLGVLARYGDVRSKAEKIVGLTQEILMINERRHGNDEIRKAARELLEIAKFMAGSAE